MKREEALEYMNRYLDRDLDAQETDRLFRHLGDSPEAQADFEFLQSLSNKLESLPDVVPPISLVDSIMPRLEEIDRAAPVIASNAEPEKLSEMESKRMLGEETTNRRKPAAFWRSALGRAVGGTTVAVAVLGIFVATYEPKEMPNAEMTPSSAVSGAMDETLVPSDGAQSTESSTSDVTDPSAEVEPIQPNTEPQPDQDIMVQKSLIPEDPAAGEASDEETAAEAAEPSTSEAAEPSTDLPASGGAADSSQSAEGKEGNASVPDPAASSGGPSGGSQNQSQSQTPPIDSSPSTESKSKKEPERSDSASSQAKNQPQTDTRPEKPKKDAANSPKPSSKPTPDSSASTGSPTAETTDEESQPNEEIGTFSIQEQEPDEQSNADSADRESSDVPPTKEVESQISGLAMEPLEWNSPDNTYLVAYSQNKLKLLKGDRSAELDSRKIDGSVAGGVWSADGKTFTYDRIKPDGTVSQETWKVEEVKLEQSGK